MTEKNDIPRPEYPRTQMVRSAFLNLNGQWDFSFDFSKSGLEKDYWLKDEFDSEITVPFCPESRLSGIGFTDFMPAVWYKRNFTLPSDAFGGRIFLHFGAVDYGCIVWINDKKCKTDRPFGATAFNHTGGYTPFTLDITELAHAGKNKIVVYAEDNNRSGAQPCGKQSSKLRSHNCDYTRTTGIWQTVWVEWTPATHIESYRVYPDVKNECALFEIHSSGRLDGAAVSAEAFLDGKSVGCVDKKAGPCTHIELPLSDIKLWDTENPSLYDIKLTLKTPDSCDVVTGYFGMRSIEIRGSAVCINGKPVFQRLVLDQGFYPDGIYTAPSDEALKNDVTRCQKLGFNGARLHQKVFEPRFLYWADRLGYICWGEYPNWGIDLSKAEALEAYLPQWLESVERDFNHPSVVGWCPFNETTAFGSASDTILNIFDVTKAVDPTRLVIDTSGYIHRGKTDIYDVHDYEQDAGVYAEHYANTEKGECFRNSLGGNLPWDGKAPLFISEYGGTWWNPKAENGWGYGKQSKSEDEVGDRYCSITKIIMENRNICGFCYTQPYDIEQEQNGLFFYDRSSKFSEKIYERIRQTNIQTAAIEK